MIFSFKSRSTEVIVFKSAVHSLSFNPLTLNQFSNIFFIKVLHFPMFSDVSQKPTLPFFIFFQFSLAPFLDFCPNPSEYKYNRVSNEQYVIFFYKLALVLCWGCGDIKNNCFSTSTEINQIHPVGVFKSCEHESVHEKFLGCAVNGLHVGYPKFFNVVFQPSGGVVLKF